MNNSPCEATKKLDSRVVKNKETICIADMQNRKALCRGKDFKSTHHSPGDCTCILEHNCKQQ